MTGRIGEMLIILLIIFVIFGAGKLPKVMLELGKGLRYFNNGLNKYSFSKIKNRSIKKKSKNNYN